MDKRTCGKEAEASPPAGPHVPNAPSRSASRRSPSHLRSLVSRHAFLAALLGGFAAFLLLMVSPIAAKGPGPGKTASAKLIALTFDDGPKPYVLMGHKAGPGTHSSSLLNLLDREGVKATFFEMGYRLADTANDFCHQIDVGINCRQAAEEVHRRGHEIENHTYGHGDFRRMTRRYGEDWVLNDIDRASRIIQSVTGVKPRYVRPPDWDVWEGLREKIEARGYHVMTKDVGGIHVPVAIEDVDSGDYALWARGGSSDAAKTTLRNDVLRRIARREQHGVYTHILVFHELPLSVEVLSTLIPEWKREGYTFVLLRDYMRQVAPAAK